MTSYTKKNIGIMLIIAIAAVLSSCNNQQPAGAKDAREILLVKRAVERRIELEAQRLSRQLGAFGKIMSEDRDFTMKLFAENDRNAPEVAEACSRFIDPMDFTLLELADSAKTIVSCAHFPANAGTSAAAEIDALGENAAFFTDTIRGSALVTLQAMFRINVLDIPLYCVGGHIVDEFFLRNLALEEGYRIILRNGATVSGMKDVSSISSVKDNIVVINNRQYRAAALDIPVAQKEGAPEMILINDAPIEKK